MSGVESRVVQMQFDNTKFQEGVKTTLNSLQSLKDGLKLDGAAKGLNDIGTAAKNITLGNIASGVQSIADKFTALNVLAITVLTNIVNKAVTAGENLVKSLTLSPIKAGFGEYEAGLTAFQTILANTKTAGATVEDVNKTLAQLNVYANQTVFSFGDMTKAIGLFTAQGVGLKDSTAAIKGIFNIVSLTGGSADQANSAIYQLSQAIASGTVKAQDWISVVNAGIGGTDFQNQLKQTARTHGIAVDAMIKKQGSFKASLQDGWLTSNILLETLQQYTGDLSAQQLKSLGYTQKETDQIIALGKTANNSATNIKSYSQLVDTLKSNVVTGWATSFKTVIGNLSEASGLWTSVGNSIGGAMQASADARNQMLSDWKSLGGRSILISAITNVFQALGAIIKPIKEAFREFFPAKTGEDLYNLTSRFLDFTKTLTIGSKTAANLKRTFAGVFAIFDIIKQVVHGVIGVFGDLFKAVAPSASGFLGLTGNLGDFLVKIDLALKKGQGLTNFFTKLSTILQVPIKIFAALGDFIGGLFDKFKSKDADNMASSFGRISDRLSPLAKLGHDVSDAFGSLVTVFGKVGVLLQPFIDKIAGAFQGLGHAISEAMSSGNFSGVLDLINTTLLGGIVLLVQRFFSKGIKINGGGFIGSITKSFSTLTSTMKTMQEQVKAKILLEIAAAIALLTVSVVALSLIDSDKLTKALGAMAVGFGELLASMAVLVKISGTAGFVKLPIIAASMILLGGALLILTLALKSLSELDWDALAKGLTGVGALLASLALAVKPLSANSAGMISAGTGIIAISVGLKILVGVVKDFGDMDWSTIGKGLAGVAASLLAIAGAMHLMPENMALQGAALILIAAALKILASAVGDFANFDYKTMARGIIGIAGSLLAIAAAMQLMPENMVLQAGALILVGLALQQIFKAVNSMAGMSWKEIGKGLVVLAGSLLILAGGLTLMDGTLPGSAALLVAAGALAILAPVLAVLGGMSWVAIAKGMTVLAGSFVILGLAGLILSPLTPVIILLSAALLAVGAGLALAGAGALAFATAFALVASVGSAGIAVVGAALDLIINAIPQVMEKLGEGLVGFAEAIGKGAPAFTAAFVAILTSLLDAIITIMPLLAKALTVLLQSILKVLNDNVPSIVQAGFNLILALLRGIANNIGPIVQTVGTIIVNFINAIANQLPKIIQAGYGLLISFINGIAKAIDDNSYALGQAGGNLAAAIVKGVIQGFAGAVGAIGSALGDAAKGAISKAGSFIGIGGPSKMARDEIGRHIPEGIAAGIDAFAPLVTKSAGNVGKLAINTLKESLSNVSDTIGNLDEMNPVITPVLDLTDVKKSASGINDLLNSQKISIASAYNQANVASAGYNANQATVTEPTTQVPVDARTFQFNQTNNSPKALSSAEIYRQTKNQISVAKGALTSL